VNNLGSGHVYGVEEAASWNVTNNWRLMGCYTYLMMDLSEPPTNTASLSATEALAPKNQFSIRSYWNVTDRLQWDNMLYYVSAIESPVDAYFRYDTRIGWQVQPGVEASLIGRNLFDSAHPEFTDLPQTQEPRSVLARITLKF
jgi:iron complex outermembrane receptor protein